MNRAHLKSQLSRQEDRRTKPYLDTVGKLTWGVGRNLADVPFSPDELVLVNQLIDLMLENDVNRAEAVARSYPWYSSLDDARQNVIVNLAFNLGASRFAQFKKFHTACSVRNWAVAVRELDDSKWQEQVDPVLGDGKGRADELMGQLLSGKLPA